MMSKVALAMALAALLLASVIPQTGAICFPTLFFVPSQGPANLSLSGIRLSISAGSAIHIQRASVRAALC